MTTTNIVSCDIGYQEVKTVSSKSALQKPDCFSFPSIAIACNKDNDINSLALRDEIVVSVNNKDYAVGNDAYLRQTAHQSRIFSENYISRPEYYALLLGALHYTGKSEIDLLVVGIPVHGFTKNNIMQQRNKLKGRHQLPNGKSVVIHDVLTIAQPIGGLVHYSLERSSYEDVRNKTNLIIDPGGLTLDWAVAQGLTPAISRCGSFSGGGINTIIESIVKQIRVKHRVNYTVLSRLEKDIQSGYITINGKQEPLTEYLETAMDEVMPALDAMINQNDGHDIDNVVLVGGGAPLFKDTIKSIFPHHNIQSIPEPYFANVRGFQILGEEYYRQTVGGVA